MGARPAPQVMTPVPPAVQTSTYQTVSLVSSIMQPCIFSGQEGQMGKCCSRVMSRLCRLCNEQRKVLATLYKECRGKPVELTSSASQTCAECKLPGLRTQCCSEGP